MPRSKSSHRWLHEHFTDPYVKQAQQQGYRSRAAYKLLEIQERDKLCRPGMVVVDLGAAPGGWAQLVAKWVGSKGKIVAVDILPMEPLAGVSFIQGDFQETVTLEQVIQALEGTKVDVILSDMSPNISGMKAVDQPRSIYLAELALDLAKQLLKPDGALLLKVFQGAGFEDFYRELRSCFKQVVVRKPKASRQRSREVYLLGKGYNRDK